MTVREKNFKQQNYGTYIKLSEFLPNILALLHNILSNFFEPSKFSQTIAYVVHLLLRDSSRVCFEQIEIVSLHFLDLEFFL